MGTKSKAEFKSSVTAAMDQFHNPHDRLKAGVAQIIANAQEGIAMHAGESPEALQAGTAAMVTEFLGELGEFVDYVFKGKGK